MNTYPIAPREHGRLYDAPFPSTRFQGSKRKLVRWIWDCVRELEFDTVLDVFGGTGAVSHLFKVQGKQVTYNDLLAFNWTIGYALIENATTRLTDADLDLILERQADAEYPTFIQSTFGGIYFTDEENRWLDMVVTNIRRRLTNPFKQALAWFALFQACIAKRPYNLFHRANLYMRQAQVARSFGNKATWDTPFPVHFRAFACEANRAVFDNGRANRALQLDALDTPRGADLVYLDPPYMNSQGTGVDYRDFYHFLEGLMDYERWSERIDRRSKHRRLVRESTPWTDPGRIRDAFEAVIARHRDSILVISYRDDGIPSKDELFDLLHGYKRTVRVATLAHQYVLSRRTSHELLLIGC